MLLHTNFSRAISSDFEETFTNYLFHKKKSEECTNDALLYEFYFIAMHVF